MEEVAADDPNLDGRSEDDDLAISEPSHLQALSSEQHPAGGATPPPPPLSQNPMHRKYFLSLLQKRMPEPYTGLDATRLSAVYFCVVGLDMLGALELIDKPRVVEYIYAMQLPTGFLGSPCLGLPHFSCGLNLSSTEDPIMGSGGLCIALESHLAMTYTALATLKTLGDDLSRIHRTGIIDDLRLYQTPSGCFQATKSGSEACDMRFLYCACAISQMLNDWSGVNRDRAADYIWSCLSYEGGFALTPGGEAHGGSTYCAVASLALMGVLPICSAEYPNSDHASKSDAVAENILARLQNWCLQRQNAIGISGRVGKESDTCYSFWIGATLKLLGAFDYSSIMTTKEFIEECESDVFGGFSKVPDAFPDVLHSFYSVAWSALAGLGGVRPLNCALAICADRV